MTLHKGRLGIGTTEPEGRLAVADEPDPDVYGLQEFPPIPLVGYKTHIEGHGEYCVSASEEYSKTIAGNASGDEAWKNFDKGFTNWTGGNSYTGTNNTYQGTHSTGGYGGDYIELKLPYKIKLQEFSIQPSPALLDRWSKSGVIMAKNTNDTTWTKISSWSGSSVASIDAYKPVYFKDVDSTNAFDTFRLVITSVDSQPYVTLYQWRLFGYREQVTKQSVLHDGQLTLTKNLNVPRIGPALDADDTPRRDRLVVEYNTSTNPTFEGAVRDTSGRGHDGVFYGTNMNYSSTEKALVFNGTDDYTRSGILSNMSGDKAVSYSLWIKTDTLVNTMIVALGETGVYGTVGKTGGIFMDNYGNLFNTVFGRGIQVSGAITIGNWIHIVATKVPGGSGIDTQTLYVNGVKPTQINWGTTGTLLSLDDPVITLGASPSLNQRFDGSISNFKLYDCALTAQEVKTLYDMGRCDEGHHVVNFSKTRVGIGLGDGEAPRGALDVREQGIFRDILFDQRSTDNNNSVSVVRYRKGGEGGNYWKNWVNTSNHYYFNYNGTDSGYFSSAGPNSRVQNFTGQHRTFIKDVPFSQAKDLEGLIVSSDQNKYIKMSGGIEAGSNAITTNESLPVVSLSTTTNDKKCFGVISASEDPETREDTHGILTSIFEKEKGDTRVYINSVGEGAIWVVNTNGSLESGDYITTSNVAGYGQKQDDDVLHNYTVAKITMDCDFNPVTQPVQQILRSNVVETYYLGNVHHTKTVPHEFVTTVVGADDDWSNVSISPSDVTYAEWSNLEANTQNTYTLTYTQTSNVVYDVKYTLTTTANVTENDPWDSVFIDPPNVTYAEYSNLEVNTQNTYTLTFTQTTTDEKTPEEWSALESNTQSLYNKVYYQSVEEEVASDYPGAVAHTRVTDRIENELDEHGQIQWEDHPTETEKVYKIRYLDASGTQTDEANAVHIAAFVGCTYHCG